MAVTKDPKDNQTTGMISIALKTWEEFEDKFKKDFEDIENLKKGESTGHISELLFRGHCDASWELSTTLERELRKYFGKKTWGEVNTTWKDLKEISWEKYHGILQRIAPAISSLTKFEIDVGHEIPKEFDWNDPPPEYEFIVHLRHFGFPAPLLDWTVSPYVAAFFAFNKADENDVAIYSFREHEGKGKIRDTRSPHINVLDQYIKTHKRHFKQQSCYTFCYRSDDIDIEKLKDKDRFYCSHESIQFQKEQDVLKKYTIPASERKKVMAKLDLMNINSFTLFGSDESLMATLAYREIERKE